MRSLNSHNPQRQLLAPAGNGGRGWARWKTGPGTHPERDLKGSGLTESDEFWLFLCGHCAKGRDDLPAFQIKGPRLTADDLRTALEKIPRLEIRLRRRGGKRRLLWRP